MNKEKVLGIVRHVLTFAGGILIAKGFIEESVAQEVIGAAMTLVGSVWSIVAKK